MDIGGDHRAVYPALPAFLNVDILTISHEDVIDGFPSLRRNGFYRSAKGGSFKSLMGKPDPAEVPITSRVKNMKGEIFIAEALGLLHDGSPKNLLRTHPMGSSPPGLDTASKVLPHHLGNDRVSIKDVADSVQLLGSRMVNGGDQYRHLITLLLAHFLVDPFCAVICGSQSFNNNHREKLSTMKCAFFVIESNRYPFLDGH
jgi:hypothetical protein